MNTVIYVVFGCAICLALYMWYQAFCNRIRIHRLSYDKLPTAFEGYRIFFISDVHRRLISYSVIDEVKGKADLVIIGGDLCEKGVKVSRVDENLKRLAAIAPCVFVWGNNDEEIGMEKLRSLLQKHQIAELVNSIKEIQLKNQEMIIAGVDDVGHRRHNVAKVIKESKNSFSILVSHYPTIVDEFPSSHPFSLMLSGHTHGGQIRLFGWGLQKKGRLMKRRSYFHLISNGYGTTGIPMRLGAPAEAHLIVLSKK
ncbi:metallophosphoesterase [Halalkalibacter nanhaiisediminis]|uniref:Calcineurin-like phosphoesterase domain-containing protein n=1 Tax=Halalkalibacter nanhaiisediminis TaxID=688079 RepID=A0A562QCX0_9BACI|nr:metallophosphoesterase [Halalkalibacter nanhaiisediminis]TWI54605.1 hypothetical protein IQ10_02826 [Halalkalibacter nanhaiisediminis]